MTDTRQRLDPDPEIREDTVPSAEVGLVVHYCFLWSHEHDQGLREGVQHRPCVVITTNASPKFSSAVAVAPIARHPPVNDASSWRLPAEICQRMGLSGKDPRWVHLCELNFFLWPGFDLGQTANGTFTYGRIPSSLMTSIRRSVGEARSAGRVRLIART